MIEQTILHYKIIEKLGEGGMGIVYLAEDLRLNRKVAIKFLPHNISSDLDEKKRFENEAQAAASLNHPNVTTIYAIEEYNEEVFIVMEYIDGIELKEKIKSGPLPFNEAINIAEQIAEGLESAHKKGIVHRDIKSQNIMVTTDGKVKIMDFGLAKIGNDTQLTKTGTTIGTAAYMSPEQAGGEEVDNRTDIWSFGVVLYEMFTGKLPFPGDYEQAVIYSILNEETKIISTVDPGMKRIVLKALTKDLNKRYQSADEIVKDIWSLHDASYKRRKFTFKPIKLRWVISAAILLILIALSIYLFYSPESDQESVKTIAVLPFTDLSPKKDQEYFSEGLTEELMNVLAQNPKLLVTSRTSAFSFKGTNTPIKSIAEKLNVKYILEGSVSRSGNEMRITAELVDVATDAYKWSNTYAEKFKDVLTLQDTISRSVAEALNVTLLGGDIPKPKIETNPDAYNDFLQGRYFSRQHTRQSLETAIGFFKQALLIDPDYARAWAALSTTHSNQAGFGYIPMEEGYREARKEVEKALELDPNLAVAYAALGWIKQYNDWDWKGADSLYRKAMKLAPENAGIIENAAQLSATLGQFNEALKLDFRAIRLDPVSASARFSLGFHSYYSGRYKEAIASFRKELELNPRMPQAHTYIGLVYLARGNLDSALTAVREENDSFWRAYGLALINFALGKEEDSDNELSEIIKEDQNDSAFQIAEIYAFRGDTDKAFEWLERAYKQRDSGLAELKGDPLMNSIQADHRYPGFLEKMKLPL